ncbi:MAG TPA: zinc ribbon domain-containing protein [Pirellulales bacterium]|nr:zinc ribbon domain-containing protein [Pirellulales bacterium]
MKARSNKCPSCGKQHVPGFEFCQRCGTPLGPELGDEHPIRRGTSDADEEEAIDLNGRILQLLERGKRKEAVGLYYEALGCDMKVAEAAIEELAKSVEFAEVRSTASAAPSRKLSTRQPAGWLRGCVAAIKSLMGFDRA